MSINALSSHSAEVEMWLDCGPHGKAKLKRITPNSVILWDAFNAPPCHARLVVLIDGQETTRPVNVINGVSRERRAARVVSLDDGAPF